MSWRILIATLLLGIAVSVMGGLQLGNWLIEHGPLKTEIADAYQDLYTMPTLDADGKPYVPTPPQPLVDGRLAVPESPEHIDWQINQESDLLAERRPIALATASGGSSGGAHVARSHVSPSGLQGLAQIGSRSNTQSNNLDDNVIQPVDMGSAPPPPSQEVQVSNLPIASNPNWQINFQRELQACDALSFTKKPSCKWDARNKYCGPNSAWGRVPGCPSKAF